MTGGEVANLELSGSSVSTIEGGWSLDINLYHDAVLDYSGWQHRYVDAYQDSVVNLTGGELTRFSTSGSSTGTITGTHVNYLETSGSSTVTVRGGTVENMIEAEGTSLIEIVGLDFMVDTGSGPTSVPYGDLAALTGTLSGTLVSGDLLNVDFRQGGYDERYTGTIRLVPEPSTALLFAGGLTALALRRRLSA